MNTKLDCHITERINSTFNKYLFSQGQRPLPPINRTLSDQSPIYDIFPPSPLHNSNNDRLDLNNFLSLEELLDHPNNEINNSFDDIPRIDEMYNNKLNTSNSLLKKELLELREERKKVDIIQKKVKESISSIHKLYGIVNKNICSEPDLNDIENITEKIKYSLLRWDILINKCKKGKLYNVNKLNKETLKEFLKFKFIEKIINTISDKKIKGGAKRKKKKKRKRKRSGNDFFEQKKKRRKII